MVPKEDQIYTLWYLQKKPKKNVEKRLAGNELSSGYVPFQDIWNESDQVQVGGSHIFFKCANHILWRKNEHYKQERIQIFWQKTGKICSDTIQVISSETILTGFFSYENCEAKDTDS